MIDPSNTSAADELIAPPAPPDAPLDLGKLQAGDPAEMQRFHTQTAAAALTDAQRMEQIAAGIPLASGPEITTSSQLSNRDFSSAVADLLDRGARPDLIASYLSTGKSDDPIGHEGAKIWFQKLESDGEMQRKLLAGDPELKRQLLAASIYMAGAHQPR